MALMHETTSGIAELSSTLWRFVNMGYTPSPQDSNEFLEILQEIESDLKTAMDMLMTRKD